ncbi:pseudouridine synthase [Streptomyces sp. Amel2xB2]|uniref:pseudouridine synthase n=1 Tax=Streptomyces sp. Amel2xB2 TaxID=1305829 RepID=UPI000DBA52C9|nr:pseudouridine synthase [Streptomyces sp. Amel2xB2]RAJ59852.1 pseudouridine synthase [Streptomyces sp. Amel2xB2]
MRSSGNSGGNRKNRSAGGRQSPRAAGGGTGRQQRAGRPRPEERRYGQGEGPGSAGGGGGRSGTSRNAPKAGGKGGPGPKSPGKGGSPKAGAKSGPKSSTSPKSSKPANNSAKGGPKSTTARGAAARSVAAKNAAKSGPRKVTASGAPKARARNASAPARPREYEAQIEERNRARHAGTARSLPKTFGDQDGERLQKVLARAGMGSRRACEELIEQGRVEINGAIVVEQGVRVDAGKDEIKVDGLTIASQSHVFFALNKPAGVVASMEDPDGRQCLGDYVQNRETRLFHVGRLDTETEGLILLTNHGELAHRLTHPRYGVRKTYLAAIQGPLPRDLGKRLKDGIRLEDGHARADHFRVVENTGKNYLVEVSLHEGRKHIVRRMLAEAGFPVERLVRTRFGPIALGDQKSGWLRRMTNTEVGMLMNEVGL